MTSTMTTPPCAWRREVCRWWRAAVADKDLAADEAGADQEGDGGRDVFGHSHTADLDSLTGQPAYVLGRRWDILAWNAAAEFVFGPYSRLEGDALNTLQLLFADADHRRLLVDWEAVARASLAMFRASSARFAGDAAFERLVARLTRMSPEFAAWWPRREVARPLSGQKHIDHSSCGRMVFEDSSFGVGDLADLKLIVFTPLEDEQSVVKLERLLRGG
jgi:hypothetical protein